MVDGVMAVMEALVAEAVVTTRVLMVLTLLALVLQDKETQVLMDMSTLYT
jgi:hypothetical protein